MIPKHVAFVLEPFLEVEKVANFDKNGKALAFTFCSIFAIFSTFYKQVKKA